MDGAVRLGERPGAPVLVGLALVAGCLYNGERTAYRREQDRRTTHDPCVTGFGPRSKVNQAPR